MQPLWPVIKCARVYRRLRAGNMLSVHHGDLTDEKMVLSVKRPGRENGFRNRWQALPIGVKTVYCADRWATAGKRGPFLMEKNMDEKMGDRSGHGSGVTGKSGLPHMTMIVILGMAGFVSAADNWVISALLPAVAADFGTGIVTAAGMLTAYLVPYGIMQLSLIHI